MRLIECINGREVLEDCVISCTKLDEILYVNARNEENLFDEFVNYKNCDLAHDLGANGYVVLSKEKKEGDYCTDFQIQLYDVRANYDFLPHKKGVVNLPEILQPLGKPLLAGQNRELNLWAFAPFGAVAFSMGSEFPAPFSGGETLPAEIDGEKMQDLRPLTVIQFYAKKEGF